MISPGNVMSRPPWEPPQPARTASGRVGLFGTPRHVLHRVATPRWTAAPLRIAVLADPHVCRPWLAPGRLRAIVGQINATCPDLIVVAGDVLPDRYLPCRHLDAARIVPHLAGLSAPLGVWSIMGNHDWQECRRAKATDFSESSVREAFAAHDLPMLCNEARCLSHGGQPFWLVGLDSQRGRGKRAPGLHDPGTAFAPVPHAAPAILLAHEPDYFAEGDTRALLQISGHTHGGQFVLFGRRPMTPSKYGDRYAIGHVREADRNLVVSAGLGYSGLPFRFGVPPEITLIELSPGG